MCFIFSNIEVRKIKWWQEISDYSKTDVQKMRMYKLSKTTHSRHLTVKCKMTPRKICRAKKVLWIVHYKMRET